MSCKSYASEHNSDVITYMSYHEWENIKEEMDSRRLSKRNKERRRKARYFKMQHRVGVIVFFIGLICLFLGCGIKNLIMQCFGGIIGIFGLHLILTKQMIIVDSYYLEHQDKMNEY